GKAKGTVGDRSRIQLMLSDKRYSRQQIDDAIREAFSHDNISPEDENVLRGYLANREEKFLGDEKAGTALRTVSRFWDASIRKPENSKEEMALLAQEQITAEGALMAVIDSEDYRQGADPAQKEMLDNVLADIFSPNITRSIAQEVLGFFGLGGKDERPDLYEQYKSARSDEYRLQLQKEVVEEWTGLIDTEFPNLRSLSAKRTQVGDAYIIEIQHKPSGALLTRRGNDWYVKFPGDRDYSKVGRAERNKLEGLSG
ncbi:MAG: hypothetical protein ABIG63_16215, partial [Chloroflexota bacterium]